MSTSGVLDIQLSAARISSIIVKIVKKAPDDWSSPYVSESINSAAATAGSDNGSLGSMRWQFRLGNQVMPLYQIDSSCQAFNLLCDATSNISFVSIKNEDHLDDLLENAHINVMLSFQQSGTKLKLINSLYKSRFCIINKNIVDDEMVRNCCDIAETEAEFVTAVNRLRSQPYLDFENRKSALLPILNDAANAKLIATLIVPNHE